ncbi:hypothetical protein AB0910_21720 [Streptomyces sp. NPDC047002]|uniref:hypothetical protein n=1 Tax=Streptomyces sp. NPDC047002 TaxID=3155475 RepID=UPI00345644A9
MPNGIDAEIDRANSLTRAMLVSYGAWGAKIAVGEVQFGAYDEMLDFVNMRMETVDSCLLLIENQKVADSLGLGRSLLEYYLLFMLMCRGRKLFTLRDMTKLTEAEFKVFLREEREKCATLRAAGETAVIDVKKAPRIARHLAYVTEGYKSEDDPDFIIPAHYFHFQQFHPETMRLKDEDYFQYYEPEPELIKALKGRRAESALSYKFYLSYDALLEFLELNELIDAPVAARIEAHYTFLGKFLHPTHDAARDLHDNSNVHYGGARIGMRQNYSKVAVLLASLYLCYLTAGLIDEAAGLIEGAPEKYISRAGTDELRDLSQRVPVTFPYFWFLFNEPPLYDRFNYCVHHATDDELQEWGGYPGVPKDRVTFDQHIYSHLQHVLGGRSNVRCGEYRSPVM